MPVPAFKALDSIVYAMVSGKGSVSKEMDEVNHTAPRRRKDWEGRWEILEVT